MMARHVPHRWRRRAGTAPPPCTSVHVAVNEVVGAFPRLVSMSAAFNTIQVSQPTCPRCQTSLFSDLELLVFLAKVGTQASAGARSIDAERWFGCMSTLGASKWR